MRLQGLDLHQVQFTIHFDETAATVGAPYIAILPIWIINFNNEFLFHAHTPVPSSNSVANHSPRSLLVTEKADEENSCLGRLT